MFSSELIDETRFSQIVADIYDCVLEPPRWRDTLARLASVMQSAGSSVIINDDWDARSGHIFEHGADQKYLRLFFQRHAAQDLRPLAEERRSVGMPTTLKMLCGSAPRAQEFFENYIESTGLGDSIAVQLLRTGRRAGWLSTARSGIQPRYGERELQLMRLFSPHLCQALAISDTLDLATLAANQLEQTVDALSAGVFLTDRGGRILYMNRSAERQIKTGNVLQLINRRLTATDRVADATLARAMATEAWTPTAVDPASNVVALPDGAGSGYLARVLQFDGGARRELMAPFRASAGVFIQDPRCAPQTEGEAFARIYGLTGAELKVLLALAPGLSANEAARELGLREPTIKTHLQRIYVKTGMSRQSELVRLLFAHAPPVRWR
jgi:DNA-binding CsgD family transcriptional regulator/PAS domain-containing protein